MKWPWRDRAKASGEYVTLEQVYELVLSTRSEMHERFGEVLEAFRKGGVVQFSEKSIAQMNAKHNQFMEVLESIEAKTAKKPRKR